MHSNVFYVVIVWHAILIAALALGTFWSKNIVTQLVVFDTLALVFVSAVVVIAVHRHDAAYLDIALVLATLAFVQTLATTRLVRTWGGRRGARE